MARYEFPEGIQNYAHMKINFTEWKMPKITEEHSKFERGEGRGGFSIYIPEGITDSVSTNWGQDEYSHGAAALGGEGAWLSKAEQSLSAYGVDFAKGVAQKGLGSGTVNAIANTKGYQVVPNQALVLQGPGYYDLSLGFEMSPENNVEAENIDAIVKMCKRYALPTKEGLLLKYPPIADIFVLTATGGEYDPVSYKETTKNLLSFTNMALTGFSASYGGDGGSFLYYHSGHPLSIKMNLSFKSVLPIWNEGVSGAASASTSNNRSNSNTPTGSFTQGNVDGPGGA